jgi:hypothetical protein
MFKRLLLAEDQDQTSRTVEVFGWITLVEGAIIMFAPYFVASVLHLPALTGQGANYFRLAALLMAGIGMLYVVSGRLNSQGFAFASLLDRPLVPPTMAVLWWLGVIPGPLALAFSIQDSAGFIWTFRAWRADQDRL